METVLEQQEKMQVFEGSEYLKYGDLKAIANVLNVRLNTVSRVFRGQEKSPRVEIAIRETIAFRMNEMEGIGEKVNELNKN